MRHFHPITLAACILLGACTVGPDYAGPPPVLSSSFPGSNGFARADEATPANAPAVAEWWTVLGDPVLDDLERRALASNPDIAVARARVDAARSALQIQRASAAPNLSAMGIAAQGRLPDIGGSNDGNGQPPPANGQSSDLTSISFYNLGLNANWEIDLFGGQRRNTEAALAELGGAEAGIADAQVSLTSAVAQAYLGYRDRQQRMALAEAAVTQREALAEIQNQRFQRGAGTLTDVERARVQLEQGRQQVSGLTAEAEGFANALAILAGERPAAIDPLLAESAALPLPPPSVSVGDPAALLQRRPDLRAAERRLAAQTARIGVTEAARLPRLSFLGILGIGGTSPSDLTNLDDFTALGAPMLQWNFLDFGRGTGNIGQAEARRDEAEAAYRSTALAALREVEDALGAFRAARANVASQARAEASTATMKELARQRFELGAAPRAHLIDAELSHAAAQDALVLAKSTLTVRFVALQKALGLGWSESPAN